MHCYRKTPVSNMGPSLEVSRRTPCVITQHGKRRLQESSASSVRDQYRTEDVHSKIRVHDLGKVVQTSMSLKMVLDKPLSNRRSRTLMKLADSDHSVLGRVQVCLATELRSKCRRHQVRCQQLSRTATDGFPCTKR